MTYSPKELQSMMAGAEPIATLCGRPGALAETMRELGAEERTPAPLKPQEPAPLRTAEAFLGGPAA